MYIISATFDVQDFIATPSGSEIMITGHFVRNSPAKGLFLALHSDNGSPDEFRALLRDGQEESLIKNIALPPSSYCVTVYDLEESVLPNPNPAIILGCQLTVNTSTGKYTIIIILCMHVCWQCISLHCVLCASL